MKPKIKAWNEDLPGVPVSGPTEHRHVTMCANCSFSYYDENDFMRCLELETWAPRSGPGLTPPSVCPLRKGPVLVTLKLRSEDD